MQHSHEAVSEDEDLYDPIISAARATMGTTNTTSEKTPYRPTRCKAFGLTRKECHQAMKTIHDPDESTTCFFMTQNTL